MIVNDLATDARPLRASALPKLLECGASVLLELIGCEDSGSSPAADTGSLVHAGAAAFHTGKDGLAALEAAKEKFPLGNVETAVAHYERYIADPQNRDAEVLKVEEPIRCRIPDPLGGPDICIVGTLDQLIRRPNGTIVVADIKTGKKYYGKTAIRHYSPQQAAYTLGARQTFDMDVQPGKLICTDGYFRRGEKDEPHARVHWWYQWFLEDHEALLTSVATVVSMARRGMMMVSPGDDKCHWCKFKDPKNCLPLVRRTK